MEGKSFITKIKHILIKSPNLILLFVFIIVSIVMSKISSTNYENTMLEVEVIAPSMKELDHEVQFFGTCEYNKYKQEYKIKWTMPSSITANLQPGNEVMVAQPNFLEYRDSHEKIRLSVEINQFYKAIVEGCYKDEEAKEQYATATLTDQEFHCDGDQVVVQVNYTGTEHQWVVPASCVYTDSISQGNESYVYVIKEEPKVWGTEYYLKKRVVNIIESNGDLSAISLYGDEYVVKYINDSRLYDKKIVKIKVVE